MQDQLKSNFIFQNDSDHEDVSTDIKKLVKNEDAQIYQQAKVYKPQEQYESVDPNQQFAEEEEEQQYVEEYFKNHEEDEKQEMPEKHSQYIETEENPQQIISDMDPRQDINIFNLAQKAILIDSQPIRTACFSPNGNYIALGTNSKSIKICSLPNLQDDEEEDEVGASQYYGAEKQRIQKLQILFENDNHHNGSLYCIDWSRSQRLIASGSNDRCIKILVTPDLDNQSNQQRVLVLPLQGHTAIVRTVCFNPADDLMLLSGGLSKIFKFENK